MNPNITEKRDEIAALCRQYGVRQLEVFEPVDDMYNYEANIADIAFLLKLETEENLLERLMGMEEDMSKLLHCKAHVLPRSVIEDHENPDLRREIFNILEPVYGCHSKEGSEKTRQYA